MTNNSFIQNFLKYFLIVLIPSFITSYLLIQHKNDNLEQELISETEWTVNFFKNHLDRFIGETITTAETLGIVLNPINNGLEEVEEVLKKAHRQDPRFSGLYYINNEGDIIGSSVQLKQKINVSDREYFKSVVSSKKTIVSEAHTGKVRGKYIVTIATPVIEEDQYNGYLLISLRLDYLENEMKVLTPNRLIRVAEMNNTELVSTSKEFASIDSDKISTQLSHVPWIIEGKPNKSSFKKDELIESSIYYIVFSLILTHVLFLLLKYIMLKRRAAIEKAQTEAQKLELVGTLAASTAHEIRNPLTGIKGLVQLLSEKYPGKEDQFYFSVIQEEISRINEIVSEFLVLGKPTAEKHDTHDLRVILQELEPIILSEANLYNTEYYTIISEEALPVICTKDHIKQVLLNITKNAFQSMSTHGKLMITLNKEADYCVIIISDTGNGIPKDALSKIFDPFFTMKESGTGLGLVVCNRIITMYGGTIDIDSEIEVGTKVLIRLPLDSKKNGGNQQ